MKISYDGTVTNFQSATDFVVADHWGASGYLNNGMRADSLPNARWSAVTNKIILTWAGTETESLGDEIFYSTFDPETLNPASPPARIHIDAAGDQFQPALDSDQYGNVLITYYSTETDPTGQQYQLFGVYLTGDGGVLAGPQALYGPQTMQYIADYHTNFFWQSVDTDGARWNATHTSAPTNSDGRDTQITGVK